MTFSPPPRKRKPVPVRGVIGHWPHRLMNIVHARIADHADNFHLLAGGVRIVSKVLTDRVYAFEVRLRHGMVDHYENRRFLNIVLIEGATLQQRYSYCLKVSRADLVFLNAQPGAGWTPRNVDDADDLTLTHEVATAQCGSSNTRDRTHPFEQSVIERL